MSNAVAADPIIELLKTGKTQEAATSLWSTNSLDELLELGDKHYPQLHNTLEFQLAIYNTDKPNRPDFYEGEVAAGMFALLTKHFSKPDNIKQLLTNTIWRDQINNAITLTLLRANGEPISDPQAIDAVQAFLKMTNVILPTIGGDNEPGPAFELSPQNTAAMHVGTGHTAAAQELWDEHGTSTPVGDYAPSLKLIKGLREPYPQNLISNVALMLRSPEFDELLASAPVEEHATHIPERLMRRFRSAYLKRGRIREYLSLGAESNSASALDAYSEVESDAKLTASDRVALFAEFVDRLIEEQKFHRLHVMLASTSQAHARRRQRLGPLVPEEAHNFSSYLFRKILPVFQQYAAGTPPEPARTTTREDVPNDQMRLWDTMVGFYSKPGLMGLSKDGLAFDDYYRILAHSPDPARIYRAADKAMRWKGLTDNQLANLAKLNKEARETITNNPDIDRRTKGQQATALTALEKRYGELLANLTPENTIPYDSPDDLPAPQDFLVDEKPQTPEIIFFGTPASAEAPAKDTNMPTTTNPEPAPAPAPQELTMSFGSLSGQQLTINLATNGISLNQQTNETPGTGTSIIRTNNQISITLHDHNAHIILELPSAT